MIDKDKRITIELTKQQLVYIQNALEEHFRLRMGQVNIGGLTDDLAMQNVDLSDSNPNRSREFDAYIERRDRGLEILRDYMKVCLGSDSTRYQKTPEVIDEIDLWVAIRHFIWSIAPENVREKTRFCTAADTPLYMGNEPPPEFSLSEQ